MLVLSRKPGEKILIGPDITVTILSNARGHVRVGIDAPPQYLIKREEIAAGWQPREVHRAIVRSAGR